MGKKVFQIEMKVRDYECDMQGIVNNANYMHYFEVARHEFMDTIGMPFVESHAQGVDPVISRADLHYKNSLVGSDAFLSSLTVTREGVKIVFHQEIHRKKDNALCCKARIEAVVLINGVLSRGDYYDEALGEYLRE